MKEKFLQIYVISTCPNDLRRYGSRSNTMRVMYFWSEIALLETREKLFTYFYFRFFMLLSGHFHTVVWIKILLTLFFFWMSVYSNFKLRSNRPFSLINNEVRFYNITIFIANITRGGCFTEFGRSFTYNNNKSGVRTEPCRILHSIFSVLVRNLVN